MSNRRPKGPVAHDAREAPTLTRDLPDDVVELLRETGKQKRYDSAPVAKERQVETEPPPMSGPRSSSPEDQLERFLRRETCDTIPAPPEHGSDDPEAP